MSRSSVLKGTAYDPGGPLEQQLWHLDGVRLSEFCRSLLCDGISTGTGVKLGTDSTSESGCYSPFDKVQETSKKKTKKKRNGECLSPKENDLNTNKRNQRKKHTDRPEKIRTTIHTDKMAIKSGENTSSDSSSAFRIGLLSEDPVQKAFMTEECPDNNTQRLKKKSQDAERSTKKKTKKKKQNADDNKVLKTEEELGTYSLEQSDNVVITMADRYSAAEADNYGDLNTRNWMVPDGGLSNESYDQDTVTATDSAVEGSETHYSMSDVSDTKDLSSNPTCHSHEESARIDNNNTECESSISDDVFNSLNQTDSGVVSLEKIDQKLSIYSKNPIKDRYFTQQISSRNIPNSREEEMGRGKGQGHELNDRSNRSGKPTSKSSRLKQNGRNADHKREYRAAYETGNLLHDSAENKSKNTSSDKKTSHKTRHNSSSRLDGSAGHNGEPHLMTRSVTMPRGRKRNELSTEDKIYRTVSVDQLQSRNPERSRTKTRSKIGKRAMSVELLITTVTTRNETTILRRPTKSRSSDNINQTEQEQKQELFGGNDVYDGRNTRVASIGQRGSFLTKYVDQNFPMQSRRGDLYKNGEQEQAKSEASIMDFNYLQKFRTSMNSETGNRRASERTRLSTNTGNSYQLYGSSTNTSSDGSVNKDIYIDSGSGSPGSSQLTPEVKPRKTLEVLFIQSCGSDIDEVHQTDSTFRDTTPYTDYMDSRHWTIPRFPATVRTIRPGYEEQKQAQKPPENALSLTTSEETTDLDSDSLTVEQPWMLVNKSTAMENFGLGDGNLLERRKICTECLAREGYPVPTDIFHNFEGQDYARSLHNAESADISPQGNLEYFLTYPDEKSSSERGLSRLSNETSYMTLQRQGSREFLINESSSDRCFQCNRPFRSITFTRKAELARLREPMSWSTSVYPAYPSFSSRSVSRREDQSAHSDYYFHPKYLERGLAFSRLEHPSAPLAYSATSLAIPSGIILDPTTVQEFEMAAKGVYGDRKVVWECYDTYSYATIHEYAEVNWFYKKYFLTIRYSSAESDDEQASDVPSNALAIPNSKTRSQLVAVKKLQFADFRVPTFTWTWNSGVKLNRGERNVVHLNKIVPCTFLRIEPMVEIFDLVDTWRRRQI